MTNKEFSQLEKIRMLFKELENSLFEVKRKLREKENIIILSWHTYSQEDLLKSKEFTKADSVVGTISSLIEGWLEHNSISMEFMHQYNLMREAFENKIENLKNEIIEREPTLWETISSGLKGLLKLIINRLPRIILNQLTGGKIFLLNDKDEQSH